LYDAALDSLRRIQLQGRQAMAELAPYDAAVFEREMALMPEWFCERHLRLALTADERDLLAASFAFLTREALAQPLVFVHRDYHSRNLMVLASGGPGIIDFQDALRGPVGYDLASILKDCYVAWPRAQVEGWLADYRDRLLVEGGGALAGADFAQFLRWFDGIGLQRHIKVLGIFARLNWRDGKPGYLDDLPRTLDYVREAAALFAELHEFGDFLERRVVPALPAANARARSAA
ncbi:aminoglycoside phosphotransferase, partial [bacterium]